MWMLMYVFVVFSTGEKVPYFMESLSSLEVCEKTAIDKQGFLNTTGYFNWKDKNGNPLLHKTIRYYCIKEQFPNPPPLKLSK